MGSSWTRDQSNPCPLNWQEDSLPLDHQGNPPDEICKKEKRHQGLLSSTNEDTVIYKLGRGSSPEPCHASTPIPDFLASRTVRSKNLSFKPLHLWYFVVVALKNKYEPPTSQPLQDPRMRTYKVKGEVMVIDVDPYLLMEVL